MIVNETKMLKMLTDAKRVLLVEPDYPRRHCPLGLAKIKTFLESQGKEVEYARQILPKKYDLICVTTLFTYYSKHIFNVLKYKGLFNTDTPILVGGVMASLLPNKFKQFKNTFVFVGYSKTLDLCVPHRDLIDMLDPPFNQYSYINTSRGCPNKCLAGNTIVNTVEGDIPIKNLVGKEIGVYTYSQKTKQVFISKAIHIREMGIKKLVRVLFDDGTFIDCTPDHRFLTWKNGNQFVPTTETIKEAKDLLPKDRMRVSKLGKNNPNYKHGFTTGAKSRIPGENHKVASVTKIGKEMTYDLEVPKTSWFFANNVLVHNCSYCAVWRIEKPIWLNPSWEKHLYLDKPFIMISDNNISSISHKHVKQIVDIAVKHDKKLYFNNGLDCKHIDTKMAKLLARAKYVSTGLRTAFDRIEEDGTFQPAIKRLIKAGVSPSNIQAYILFNYLDKPKDADYRARTCADFRITPYPQRYTKLNALSRKNKYVGKHWTLGLANVFRFFWLLRGHYYKYSFDEFLKMRRTRVHFNLTDKDIGVWDNNGVK